ncbi:DUF5710 domain-containing protein [Xenorhabdus innexi]|uniref:DNA primase n=1 Tax=Xenorhabdus innexi TaxID=290109 RepID=A0A1N6N0S8_9GAMM|nr:DUF5710 domain-containing protein [Xenorhabdus innexi]PHM27687.1 DNA primase [Xenorhabdus innexi]SIP74644.1 conserved hypothetical protein [Xenorhabdus innexi]
MLRIDLNVPDAEHEQARKPSAHWDAVEQIGYIDNSIDPTPFINWLPFYNVHADAQTQTAYPHCQGNTTVTAFMLPAGHQRLEADSRDKPDTEIDYTVQDCPAFLFYLADLPTLVCTCCPAFTTACTKLSASHCNGSTG